MTLADLSKRAAVLRFREIHLGCGGTVVLDHEVWRCQKCRKAPVSTLETKTVSEEHKEP